MTPDQWTTLVGQLGVGGVVILLMVKVLFPMLAKKLDDIVTAQRETTAAVNHCSTAIAGLAERVSRLEGIWDHDEPERPRLRREARTRSEGG